VTEDNALQNTDEWSKDEILDFMNDFYHYYMFYIKKGKGK